MNKKPSKFSPEVRERAVRLVREQRSEHPSMWAAIESIAPMIGCTPQTLLEWVKRVEPRAVGPDSAPIDLKRIQIILDIPIPRSRKRVSD
jgi:transposase